jgi:hypothetical protein
MLTGWLEFLIRIDFFKAQDDFPKPTFCFKPHRAGNMRFVFLGDFLGLRVRKVCRQGRKLAGLCIRKMQLGRGVERLYLLQASAPDVLGNRRAHFRTFFT